MEEIVFLGTGGGRFVTIMQKRATGGFRINLENLNICVDPGPGSLVRARYYKQNPQNLKCLLVSHNHPDHCTDAPVIIEAITRGTTHQRGYLLASKSVIEGTEQDSPSILKYHLDMLKEYQVMSPGDEKDISGVKIKALEAQHRDPSTIGFRIQSKGKVISYTSDTAYFKELADLHKDSDILILNVLRPANDRINFHLCSEDVVKVLKSAKPKIAIVQHFGMKMLQAGPVQEAQTIQDETGIRTIPARDGMHVSLDETDQSTLGEFRKNI